HSRYTDRKVRVWLELRVVRADAKSSDAPHRLLSVVASVTERVRGCRYELHLAESSVDFGRPRFSEDPEHPEHHDEAEDESNRGRDDDEYRGLLDAFSVQDMETGLGDPRSGEPTDE